MKSNPCLIQHRQRFFHPAARIQARPAGCARGSVQSGGASRGRISLLKQARLHRHLWPAKQIIADDGEGQHPRRNRSHIARITFSCWRISTSISRSRIRPAARRRPLLRTIRNSGRLQRRAEQAAKRQVHADARALRRPQVAFQPVENFRSSGGGGNACDHPRRDAS